MKRDRADAPALEKPRQPGGIRAVILAVMVHAAFFGLIVFGVTWQSKPTPPMQAELWDKLPPAAKSPPVKSEPKLEPPKPDPPKPEPPKPEPPKPKPPEPAKPEPVKPDPAIALKAEREKRERLEKQKADEKTRREQEKAEKKKAEKAEAERKKREEEIAKQAAEKARAEVASARQKEIDGFIAQIKAKIRGRANVPDTVTGTPEVHVRIRILPGGEVLDIAVTKPSGNPAYDTAIERAIRSASPLPVPEARSELFPIFRDLNLQIRHER